MGVAALPEVQDAMKSGMLVCATGTTNAYVLQELMGDRFDLRRYRSGITTPDAPEKNPKPAGEAIPDAVFRNGKLVKELNRMNAPEQMKKGDVYIKGANALDYVNQVAGVLIGGGSSGTLGAVMGNIIGKQITMIIPIGLEKLIYEDIDELYLYSKEPDFEGPALWPLKGLIITEIEALEILTGVQSTLYSAGGVAGAEGSVRLLIDGDDESVNEALALVKSIKGEPRYLL